MICKICKKNEIYEVLNLGLQPLANKYPRNKNDFLVEKTFPLSLLFCSNCLNVQIKNIIDRKEMFEDYYYLSSVNESLVSHFENLAKKLSSSSFIVDIGSNDGILLKPLKSIGIKSLGIDPSINVGKIANDKGLETLIGFFNSSSVEKIINDYGKPDTIVASSVFTHIESPKQFAIDIKNLIEENGFLILEVEYLSNFIKKIQFERFYFDRPFYYSLLSIKILFQQVGMSLVNVEHIDIHGGSIRCYIKNSKDEKSTSLVEDILKKEKLHLSIETFKIFQKKIIKETTNLKEKLNYFKRSKKKVIGYGAPARVSTITNFANIDYNHIDFIIDDSPLKQDRYTPGTHIPIISREKSKSNNVDIIIVFAYEYFKEIKELTKNYNCEYFQPIPFCKLS